MIDVTDLRKRYGSNGPEALRGVSFSVDEGEIFGLLGPNGAGKTTTIGILTTRVVPTGGTAIVEGIDVTADPVAVKQRIAVVAQRPNVDRAMTVVENLTFHGAYFGYSLRERRHRAEELLDAFGLLDRKDDKIDIFSGGMTQRIMIARALMHRPKVLFLDEPTTGLDPQSRLFLWEQIDALRAAGTTILLTTHDMAEADRLCDRIAIVDHGERIALDTPAGLRDLLPGSRGIELTLDTTGDPVEAFARLGQVETAADNGQWQVRVFGDDVTPSRAIRVAEGLEGAEIADLHRLEGSLEDVFVHLTGRDLR